MTSYEKKEPGWASKFFKADAVYHMPGVGTIRGLKAVDEYIKWSYEGIEKIQFV